jgi:hypothetical protein
MIDYEKQYAEISLQLRDVSHQLRAMRVKVVLKKLAKNAKRNEALSRTTRFTVSMFETELVVGKRGYVIDTLLDILEDTLESAFTE